LVAIVYILAPIDLIPDFIPIIGYIDDFLMMKFILLIAQKDIDKYELWRAQANNTEFYMNGDIYQEEL